MMTEDHFHEQGTNGARKSFKIKQLRLVSFLTVAQTPANFVPKSKLVWKIKIKIINKNIIIIAKTLKMHNKP